MIVIEVEVRRKRGRKVDGQEVEEVKRVYEEKDDANSRRGGRKREVRQRLQEAEEN